MADKKISAMGEITSLSAGDYFPFIDISQSLAANKNKRVTYGNLAQNLGSLFSVLQSTHGFAVGNLIRYDQPLDKFTKSQADTEAHAWVDGIVISVEDANNFTICPAHGARISGIGGGALVGGKKYYLDASTAGAYTITAPAIERLVFTAISDSTILFHNDHASGGSTTFADDVFDVHDNSDATKKIMFELSGQTTGKTITLTSTNTQDGSINIPDIAGVNDTFVVTNLAQTISLKSLKSDCSLVDKTDITKQLDWLLSGNTTGVTGTIRTSCTNTRIWDFPDVSGTLLLGAGVDGRIAVYEGTNEIGTIAGFTYDGTTLSLPINNYITGSGALTLTATGAKLNLIATGANVISFDTNGAERMQISSDGRVGIGNTPVNGSLEIGTISTPTTAYGTGKMFIHCDGEADNIVLTTVNTTNRYPSIQFRGTNPAATTQNWSQGQISGCQIGGTYQQGQLVFSIATANNTFQRKLVIASLSNDARIGIGNAFTSSVPSYNLSFMGTSAQTMGVERHTATNTAGVNGTFNFSGSATSGATDKDAGMATLSLGLSTGTGKGSIRLQRLTRAASTSTADNSKIDGFIMPSRKHLTDNTAIDLFDVVVTTGQMAGGIIDYTIFCTDGTDFQVHTGIVTFQTINKGGTVTADFSHASAASGLEKDLVTAGRSTITDTFANTAGASKSTVSVNANSSLTPSILFIEYNVNFFGSGVFTQL